MRYTENFDLLVALITHLSSTSYKSRTPSNVARALEFKHADVERVLASFPAFFRKSKRTKDGEHYYTVHLRYARRERENEEGGESQPLEPPELTALIDLVLHMTAQEQENSRQQIELQARYRFLRNTNFVTLGVAILAAVAAIVAAILSAN